VSLSASGDLNVIDTRQSGKPSRILYGHQRPIMALAREKSGTFFSGSYDGRINTFSAEGHCTPVQGTGHSNQVMAIATDSGRVVSVGMDDTLRQIDVTKLAFAPTIASTSALPKGLAIDSTGHAYVVTTNDIQIFKDGQKVFTLPASFQPGAVAVSPKGNVVAAGGEDSKVRLYKSTAIKLEPSVTGDGNRSPITALAFSPDGALVAAGDTSGKIIVYDVASGEVKTAKWVFHSARITSITWSPNGQYAASTSLDTNVYVWNLAKPMSRIAIKNAHPGGASACAWVDSDTIATAGADATIRIFKLTHHS